MNEKNLDYFEYNGVRIGCGNFKLPPVLIGTMFYDGQTIFKNRDGLNFNEEKAKKRIDKHLELSNKYKIPSLIEISGSNPDTISDYLKFYLDNYNAPFVLGGTFDVKAKGLEYLRECGTSPDEYIYNSISNLKNKKEIELIEQNHIQSVVILSLGSENMTSTQRYNYLVRKRPLFNKNILDSLKHIGVERIWLDGGVINLESLAHILETQKIVSSTLKIPVGTAPSLFLFKYSSPKLNKKFHTKYRRSSIISLASWFSNFIFYGAIEDSVESFAGVYQAWEFKKILKEKNIKLFD
jgi:tetrahydromethanopterin S-methyltransferase subunit H